jgi:hypothetical protein
MVFRPSAVYGRSLGGPMRGLDLEEVERLRGERGWREGGRARISPRGGGGLGVVMLPAMRSGGRFEEHFTPGPIPSVVCGGRILFAAGGEGGPETVLTCDAGVRNAAEDLGGAVCRIDVARGGRLGSTSTTRRMSSSWAWRDPGSSRPTVESTPWLWEIWSSCPGALGVRPGAPPRASPTSPPTGGAGRSGSELE